MNTIQVVGAVIFFLALAHTFTAKFFEELAHKAQKHAGLFHLPGEIEVVFGFWAFTLIVVMAAISGIEAAVTYAESCQYTEALFVFDWQR